MKKIAFLTICLLSIFLVKAQPPVFDWVNHTGNPDGNIFILSSVTDSSGNLYMTGVFDGIAVFHIGSSTDTLTDAGFGDIFISKIDSAGNFKWMKQVGKESYDQGSSIALDDSGNIYVTGFFSLDSTDFDPGFGTYYLSDPMNGALTFILKLDASGNFQWAKELESGSNNSSSLTLDASNNILITGLFEGTVDFDPGIGVANFTTNTNGIYILKLTNAGDYSWSKQIDNNTSSTRSYSIATDADENIYITGLLTGTVDFDPDAGITNLTATTAFGGEYILKLDSGGNFKWAKIINGELSQTGADRAIQVDYAGNSFTAGWFGNTVDFNPNAGVFNLTNTITTGSSTYILKLDSSGNFVWAKQIGDPGDGNFRALRLDASSNLFITGMINSTGDFDPNTGTDTLSPINGNTFVSKYDSSGNLSWAVNFSNKNGSSNHSQTINVDPFGNVITTGVFHDTCDFDPGSGVFNLTSNSGEDVFIHKMNPNSITSINEFKKIENNWFVYPNPSSGAFHFTTKNPGVYFIANASGQILRSFSVQTANQTIAILTGLPNGVYFISGTDKKIPSKIKIVIQD